MTTRATGSDPAGLTLSTMDRAVIPASAKRVSGNLPKGATLEIGSGFPLCAALGGNDKLVLIALIPGLRS